MGGGPIICPLVRNMLSAFPSHGNLRHFLRFRQIAQATNEKESKQWKAMPLTSVYSTMSATQLSHPFDSFESQQKSSIPAFLHMRMADLVPTN